MPATTVERYETSQMAYQDLPPHLRQKYPPTKAKYGGDAIAEREGLLPPAKSTLTGWRCAAQSKLSGFRCQATAVAGSLLCRSHGGNQQKGAASPQYRDGSRSQALPLRLQAQYQAAIQDPDLLSLRQDLGVLELRVTELLGRLDTGESSATWQQVQDLGTKVASALEDGNPTAAAQYLAQLQEVTGAAVAGSEAWQELRAVLRDRATLATLEQKRLLEVQGTVPVEAFLAMLGHLMQRLHSILLTSLEAPLARSLLGQFQQEVLLLQQHGLQAPKLRHQAIGAPRVTEPGTRRTVNPDGSVYQKGDRDRAKAAADPILEVQATAPDP